MLGLVPPTPASSKARGFLHGTLQSIQPDWGNQAYFFFFKHLSLSKVWRYGLTYKQMISFPTCNGETLGHALCVSCCMSVLSIDLMEYYGHQVRIPNWLDIFCIMSGIHELLCASDEFALGSHWVNITVLNVERELGVYIGFWCKLK